MIVDSSANRRLTLAAQSYATLVAGIYSTKPEVLAATHKKHEAVSRGSAACSHGDCSLQSLSGERTDSARRLAGHVVNAGSWEERTDRNRMLGAVVRKAREPLSEGFRCH